MNLKRRYIAFIFLLVLFSSNRTFGQRNYVNETVPAEPNITDANRTNSVFLFTSFLGSSGPLELRYRNSLVKAGTTTFIRIDMGSLSAENITSQVTLNAYYNGSLLSAPVVKLVQIGSEKFLSVTPTENYNSIKIALVPKIINSADIYYAFNGFDQADCGSSLAVSPWPEFLTAATNVCINKDTSIEISNPLNGQEYYWYDKGNLIYTGPSFVPQKFLSIGVQNIFVTTKKPDCTVESIPHELQFTIHSKPSTPNIHPIN